MSPQKRLNWNLRRGFFRIWVVLSTIYVLAIGIIFYGSVAAEFKRAAQWDEFEKIEGKLLLLPVRCVEARGARDQDYDSPPWEQYTSAPLCYYTETNFRRLYPQYQDLSHEVLVESLWKKAGKALTPRPQPWNWLMLVSLLALAVPISVAGFGAAIGWAFAGFSTTDVDRIAP